uniref:Fms interacting protein, putative n=1 Tax=Arundo donax TaxID=35708 RepID=A0A0A9GG47_ARUDO
MYSDSELEDQLCTHEETEKGNLRTSPGRTMLPGSSPWS